MPSHPMARTIYGAPRGGVMGFLLYIIFWFRSSPLIVGGAGAARVAWPLEVGKFGLDFFTSPYRFFIAICSAMLSGSLVERRLDYSTTCSTRVLFPLSGSWHLLDPLLWIVPDLQTPWTFSCFFFYACADAPPLTECLLSFMKVCLHLYEICLQFSPCIFRILVGAPGLTVLLKLACLRNQAVWDVYYLSFCDGITRLGCIIHALVEPHIEALERLVGIEGLPQLLVVYR